MAELPRGGLPYLAAVAGRNARAALSTPQWVTHHQVIIEFSSSTTCKRRIASTYSPRKSPSSFSRFVSAADTARRARLVTIRFTATVPHTRQPSAPQASQASSFNSRGVAAARSSHARPSLPPRFMLADASGIHTRSASHAPITLPARTLSTRVARRSSGGFWVVCVVAGLTLAASRAVPSTPSRPAAISNSGREYHPRCIASGELRALETHG